MARSRSLGPTMTGWLFSNPLQCTCTNTIQQNGEMHTGTSHSVKQTVIDVLEGLKKYIRTFGGARSSPWRTS